MNPKHCCTVIIFTILLFQADVLGQSFLPGKLYLKVEDRSGIPTIVIDATDTSLTMSNSNLQSIFQTHHVYKCGRSFPIADSMKSAKKFGLEKIYTLTCDCNEKSLLDEMAPYAEGIYTYVEQIPEYHLIYTPNDYHLLDNDSISGPDSALNLINAKRAWEFSKGDTTTLIGICDANLRAPSYWNHEDIIGKIVFCDTIGGDNLDFHGLFVSGCAAANTDNAVGKSGIGFNCKIAFTSHRSDSGILFLSQQGAKVVNASWGAPLYYQQTFQDIINAVTENGTLVVAGAGNDPFAGKYGYYFYPASYKNVLSVTSIDFNDHFLTWDTGIINQHHNYNDSVDICAPGYHVVGLWDACRTCYKRSSGTSFASPIVAGTAGLIFSVNPCLKPADVTYILKSTANDTIYSIAANQPFLDSLGAGRLDAGAALHLADSLYKPRDYHILTGQTITWDINKYVKNEIAIDSGAVLTIQATALFNKNAGITVKRGGKLIVDGGKLTSACSCEMWDGIDLWGNRGLDQYTQANQGVAIFENGAIVENALVAIGTMRPKPEEDDDLWGYEQDYTGGIIEATNAIFRNNQKAGLILPYENHNPNTNAIADNRSHFDNCVFETTDDYADSTITFTCFVDLQDVRGVRFIGCIFQNTQTGGIPREALGIGIYSVGASIYVKEGCVNNNVPCTQILPSTFSNLNYGIKALGTDPVKTISVDKSVFSNNYTGIYLGSIQLASITRDTFEVRSSLPESNSVAGGLYLNECHYYMVTENYFYSGYAVNYQTQAKSVGVAVNNSNLGAYIDCNNEIYNNRFEKLNFGIMPMNKNRSNTNGENGLLLRCNDFIFPNQYDIAVTLDTATSNKGIKYSQGSNVQVTTAPAGNTFSYSWQAFSQPYYSDFFNQGENLIYWYHLYGGNTKPQYCSPSVDTQYVAVQYFKTLSCPSILSSGSGGEIEDLIVLKEEYGQQIDSVSDLLSMLVDGGDTPGTETLIQSSSPQQTLLVRNDLLSKTPYLSDTVIMKAASKEDVLPPAIITEILSANPQAGKSDTVVQILENRIIPLSDEQMQSIEEGSWIIGARESLEARKAGFQSAYNEVLNRILTHYKNDSLNPAASDSLTGFLGAENQLWARYSQAFEYLSRGDTVNACTVLATIPVVFPLSNRELLDHQRYEVYFGLVTALLRQGRGITEADSLQIQTISSLYNESDGLIGCYARNLLQARNLVDYTEPYYFPEGELKEAKIKVKQTGHCSSQAKLDIYPNPARDYIIIQYGKDNSGGPFELVIANVEGKVFRDYSLDKTTDYIVISIDDLAAGSYLCCLKSKGLTAKTRKFMVIK